MNFRIYIYDGETGEYWGKESVDNTSKIKETLLNGYAVQMCNQNNNPVGDYQDNSVGTDSDGFAYPIKP